MIYAVIGRELAIEKHSKYMDESTYVEFNRLRVTLKAVSNKSFIHKSSAAARLQVLLESKGLIFIREINGEHYLKR